MAKLTSRVLGKNHVEVTTGGYMLDIQVQSDGLVVFVYNEETISEGCVAMAYDPLIPLNEYVDLALTGEETP